MVKLDNSTKRQMAGDLARLIKKLRRNISLVRVIGLEFREFFICLASAMIVSTLVLHSFYPRAELPHPTMTWMQAVYYTWLMIFFQTPLNYVHDWRIVPLFFALPILGLLTIAEGVVHLGNLLFHSKRFSWEWQQMLAATLDNHVVVCGLGNVGVRVIQHLSRFDEPAVVIEQNAESRFINEMASYDVPVIVGDARDLQVLQSANISKAKAIIAVTDNDLANLEAALTAREHNPAIRIVIRMFDQKLAKKIQKSLGIEGAYSSSARSARLFAQAAISGDIVDSFEFGGTVINAVQIVVEAGMQIVGQTIDDVRQKHEVTVLLQEKHSGEVDWNPSPNNVLNVGDRLLIMTDRDGLKRLSQSTRKSAVTTKG
ncbi:MAG TPA: TrkA family potassium uptake protein [Planktothrix sp.]|jgi:Trk K+ transport system NAD-binding subunit